MGLSALQTIPATVLMLPSSSGIQILPSVQPLVKQLITFIRSPTWIAPPAGMEQKTYADKEKEVFVNSPSESTKLRKLNETQGNHLFWLFLKETQLQKTTKEDFIKQMKAKLANVPDLHGKLIPSWAVGCRRLTPGTGYLESLSKPNVQVKFGTIASVTRQGIKGVDGEETPLDVLICATGFDTSFRPRFPIYGVEGRNLQDEWGTEARSYMGLAAPKMPNYLHFLGPNSPVGNGPVLIAVEHQADYMLALCDRWQTENIHSFVPKEEAVAAFTTHTHEYMQTTVFSDDCNSWYKSNSKSGRISVLWPGSTLHYLEAIKDPRWDDWHVSAPFPLPFDHHFVLMYLYSGAVHR